ncbi:MAG: hypothetical protein HQK49_22080 [Oligoflexia bacterium]|nr:hypothetical protein [Oligoflexia bacterium]
MIAFIQENKNSIAFENFDVSSFHSSFSNIDENYLDKVNIDIPIIRAEIVPEIYNVLDGNHRVKKAQLMGVNKIKSYRLTMRQHVYFLTSEEAYKSYVSYWNEKLS